MGHPLAAEDDMARGRSRRMGLAVLFATMALVLAACGGPGSSSVANLGTNANKSTATAPRTNDAAQSLVQWATCMRSHGDPDQPDPTIDIHGGINIDIPESGASLSNAVHNGTAPCNNYLAAASAALRAGASDLTPPNQAALVRYSECMRANGLPNYPDPGTGGKTNFNGTGIDLNSPSFQRANKVCGKEIKAPSWWISGAGPPGDISVQSGPMCGNSVCTPSDHGNIPHAPTPTTGG